MNNKKKRYKPTKFRCNRTNKVMLSESITNKIVKNNIKNGNITGY